MEAILVILIVLILLFPIRTLIFTGFINPFSLRKFKKDVKSEVKSNINPYWKIRKFGTIHNYTAEIGIYVEIYCELNDYWTNDIINFSKIDGNWKGDFSNIKRAQNMYDDVYQRESGVDLKLKKIQYERDRKLSQLGI